MTAKKKPKSKETVIVLRIPDATSKQGTGTLSISRGELGHLKQFEYRGLTLVGNIVEAVKSALEALMRLEAAPPEIKPTDSASSSDTPDEPLAPETEDEDSEEEAEEATVPDESETPLEESDTAEAQPLVSDSNTIYPVTLAFCKACGHPHQTVLNGGEHYQTHEPPHQQIEHCTKCAAALDESSVPCDVALAQQAYPLPDQYQRQVVPSASDEDVRAIAIEDAENPQRSFNILWLHKLPPAQAAIYMQTYQKARSGMAQAIPITLPVRENHENKAQITMF